MSGAERCVRILVSGRVQGVWFRDSTRRQAESLEVRGWVRNLTDGRVEAVLQGSSDRIQQMIDWCRQGPPLARVEHLSLEELTPDPALAGFTLRPTTGP